jgi:hypothetical protein
MTEHVGSGKLAWSSPKIVEVGGIEDETAGEKENVNDSKANTISYAFKISRDDDEVVDLGDR